MFDGTRAMWQHQNEVVFKGKTDLTDDVVHDVEGAVSCWFRIG